jgi:hypothetical protein
MSRITLPKISASSGGAIQVQDGNTLHTPGTVVQTIYVRTEQTNSYAQAITGNGTAITDLNLIVSPRYSNSFLVMQWMVNCEVNASAWDSVFLIHKNGNLVTDNGYQGYNAFGGNNRWSGIAAGMYDVDNNSTMGNYFLQYGIPAMDTSTQTFSLATRSANATARTLLLNRTVGVPADNFEVAISSGVLWEIAQ